MSITQGNTPGASYVWSNVPGDWGDQFATDTAWENAYPDAWWCTESVVLDFVAVAGKEVTKNVSNAFGFSVAEARDVEHSISVAINFNELSENLVAWINAFYENLNFVVVDAVEFTMDTFEETLDFVDGTEIEFTKDILVSLDFDAVQSDVWSIERDEAVTLDFSIGLEQDFINDHLVTLDFLEQIIRNANAPIYDVLFFGKEMTLVEMDAAAQKKSPVGYHSFVELRPGDFEYKDAFVGMELTTTEASNTTVIDGATLNVDVPDVVERATTVISSAVKTEISFTKTFHVTPEIAISSISGATPFVAHVSGITTTKFDVELKEQDNATALTTGSVTWIATGY